MAAPASYKTYVLSDPNAHSRLEVVPERGGIVTRWQFQGQEIFYLDEARFANPDLSVRGGMPILFPICGNLPDNTYTYKDQRFQLKQHGFARDLPWEVQGETPTSLTLALNSTEKTLEVYPFQFQVIFTYQLAGNTLEIHQRYTNFSQEAMPFATGLHPYFLTNDKTQLQFRIPTTQMWDKVSQETGPFPGSFDMSRDEIDAALRPLTGQSAAVTDGSRNWTITLTYGSVYSTLVFWTLKGKDYYCLEPWSSPRNALNTGEDLVSLTPGASLETSVTIGASCSKEMK